ncbi:protein jagunal homolog 1 [Clonorchis sinensis]|uniref:Protein jagunal homolog 1 n=1 Tax=Clonorchis sinensis TaxID=79923 RepID=G7YPM3_CLOSI|nr:protein jagunal homolog 1 [Clonorchis sinensis]
MTSRAGPRPTGTDGTDFRHREKVAVQYNQGPLLKRRIRVVFMLHFALWLLMFVRLFPELCLRFGFKTRSLVEKVHGFSVYFGYKLYSLWSQHSARKSR